VHTALSEVHTHDNSMVGVTLTVAIPGARGEGGGGGWGGWSAILKSGLLFLYIIINVQGPK
jgi:hypothetical protein